MKLSNRRSVVLAQITWFWVFFLNFIYLFIYLFIYKTLPILEGKVGFPWTHYRRSGQEYQLENLSFS
jgi:hypothetical protein